LNAAGVELRDNGGVASSGYAAPSLRIGPRTFVWGARTYVMGVVNVSPESFSGDGVGSAGEAAALARRLAAEGADVLDVGGQSTRPGWNKAEAGFDELPPEEEIRRVGPAIEAIRAALPDMPISVDTYKPAVARAAFEAGAHMLNDIYGLRGDPALARIAAERGAPVCVMHNQRGRSPSGDVIADIVAGLAASIRAAEASAIGRDLLIADPGFGFGWKAEQNLEMLRRLGELRALGVPLLVGTSRKSTIGMVLGGAPVEERLFGTAASVAIAIANGADIVRVHDVRAMREVARVTDAIVRGWSAER
jgi:dihydropteroate synthase